jgi:hypothetical protein
MSYAMCNEAEPPSSRAPSTSGLFFIGRNSRGNWVVREQSGLRGGLFIDRTEALRFALFENGRRPQAVVMVPGVLELDLDHSGPQASNSDGRFDRKAA